MMIKKIDLILTQFNHAKAKNTEMSTEDILFWFDLCEAYWLHSGDPKDPHAELTSGKCSNGFFNCLNVLQYVTLSDILAHQLVHRLRKEIGHQQVDWVIASPMAGITFGHDVARALGAKIFFFTEKDSANKGEMLWNRVTIPAGETVLQIEELITTAKTLNAVQAAVDAGNKYPVNWLPFIGTLVHRPSKLPITHYENREVVALIEKEVWAEDQKDCHLCKNGSKRYKPKANWNILTKKIEINVEPKTNTQ